MNVDQSPRALARAVDRVVRGFEQRAVGGETLSPRVVRVLERLDREGGATTSELAAEEGVRHQSMAAALGELHRLGFISRRQHPDDVRKIVIEITEDGRDQLGEQRRLRLNWLVAALEQDLGDADREVVAAGLSALLRVIEQDQAGTR